jgi:methyl-accepting chemotaxis protein
MQANAEALEAGQNWIAALDLALLERAAIAAHRRSDLIPSEQGQSQRLNEQVTLLKGRVDEVATAVGEIKAAMTKFADEVRQLGEQIKDRIDRLDARVGEIDERVKKLEASTGSQPP